MTITAVCITLKTAAGPGPSTNPAYTDPLYHPAG